MLDDLGRRVDSTDSRLGKVRRTLDDFIRRNEGTELRCHTDAGAFCCSNETSTWLTERRDEERLVYRDIDRRVDNTAALGHYHMTCNTSCQQLYWSCMLPVWPTVSASLFQGPVYFER